MSEVPYRHPAFGDPPRRRRPGDPPLPKVRKQLSPESFKRAPSEPVRRLLHRCRGVRSKMSCERC